jgi:nicotinate-nucleotide pyrophosphorylase (carboxylating)
VLLETLDKQIHSLARHVLEEDVGSGDITAALIPEATRGKAQIISREAAILCGSAWFDAIFAELDTDVRVSWQAHDGDSLQPGEVICQLEGRARSLLTGERAALNLLQTLSGTATLARRYADAVKGLPVRILDTRKTLPGLRIAQKYAVRTGGCHNHRTGLYDGILIKENHIAAAGSVQAAVEAARRLGTDLPIEIEVEALDQIPEALKAGADILLLDNFDLDQLRTAVTLNRGQARLEASGGVSLDTLREIAATGVDAISVGALTKNVRAVDLSMRFI